jgi:ABC-2 type transport system ATP-binding protein
MHHKINVRSLYSKLEKMVIIGRIEGIREHFKHKDSDLAYSTLLDCVLDSERLDLFEQVIANEHWKEENPEHDHDMWLQKCEFIINRLEEITLPEKIRHESLVESKNLLKRYARGNFKLGPLSFSLQPGQLIGLVGENGNGKTTLLRILAKEVGYDEGELHYHNEADFDNSYDHRTKLVYIPQRTQKWDGKIRTNLRFCATHYGIMGRRNELLVEMMMIRFGLFKFRDLNWSELSSGYKMRFELARTFLRRPEILLLDEPLANLDVFAQQIVLNDLRSLAKSSYNPIGIILSSQQLFEVEKVADEVLFLKNGAPKLLESENQNTETKCVVELETSANRDAIKEVLATISDVEIHFNGGMYVISSSSTTPNEILEKLISGHVPVNYFRNISESSKRFFIAN